MLISILSVIDSHLVALGLQLNTLAAVAVLVHVAQILPASVVPDHRLLQLNLLHSLLRRRTVDFRKLKSLLALVPNQADRMNVMRYVLPSQVGFVPAHLVPAALVAVAHRIY